MIQNVEKKTDEINTTLTTSQRHLNNIKSVFGGIKNWWGTKKEASPTASEQKRGSSLDSIVKKNQESASVSSSSRGLGEEGSLGWGEGGSVYQKDADLDSQFMASSSSSSSRYGRAGGGSSSLQYVQPITRSAREEELDKNLGQCAECCLCVCVCVCVCETERERERETQRKILCFCVYTCVCLRLCVIVCVCVCLYVYLSVWVCK